MDQPLYFISTLRPGRSDFLATMPPGEKAVMGEHAAYTRRLFDEGKIILGGAATDGAIGVIVWKVGPAEEAREIFGHDPAVKANVGPTMSALVSIIVAMFAGDTSKLGDFGVKAPRARTPLTTEQKAAAVAKRKATRTARGTKGPKAKAEITGNVTGVEITPITAPAPVEPTAPQPAAAAPIAPAGASK